MIGHNYIATYFNLFSLKIIKPFVNIVIEISDFEKWYPPIAGESYEVECMCFSLSGFN